MNNKEITIDGVVYVPKAECSVMAKNVDGMRYCIIRTYSAGVHAGYLKDRENKAVILVNSRRLWQWKGAFTLSEMAKYGVKEPKACKFATAIAEIILTEAIEIIPCTEEARKSIESVADYEC